jgi:hypothetical protein
VQTQITTPRTEGEGTPILCTNTGDDFGGVDAPGFADDEMLERSLKMDGQAVSEDETVQLFALLGREQPSPAKDQLAGLHTDRLAPVSLNDNEDRKHRYANTIMTKERGKHYMRHYAKKGIPQSPGMLREGNDLKVVVDGWSPELHQRQNGMQMRGIWSRAGLESDKASLAS